MSTSIGRYTNSDLISDSFLFMCILARLNGLHSMNSTMKPTRVGVVLNKSSDDNVTAALLQIRLAIVIHCVVCTLYKSVASRTAS